MPGDSGGPWVFAPGAATADGGKTQNAVAFGVTIIIANCKDGGRCADAVTIDLTNPAVNAWVANTAHTIMASSGTSPDFNGSCTYQQKVECIVQLTPGGGPFGIHVKDGFGHPIGDLRTLDCLLTENSGIPKLTVRSFVFDEIPLNRTPATCTNSVSTSDAVASIAYSHTLRAPRSARRRTPGR